MPQSDLPLAGLKLLLTRPEGQATDWQRDLQQLGAALRHVPVLAVEAIPMESQTVAAQALRATLRNLQRYDIGVFVSTNAVRYAQAWLIEQQLPIPAGLLCYAVGDKTTHAAAEVGFKVVTADAVDSESLLSRPELQRLQGKRVLVFRGQGGRELITQTLRARGAAVTHAELYERRCAHENEPALDAALKQWRPHIISVTSVASAHNLLAMARATGVLAQLLATPLLAPGERVTEAAQTRGCSKVLTARSIRFTDVSYALREWWSTERVSIAGLARVSAADNEMKKAK